MSRDIESQMKEILSEYMEEVEKVSDSTMSEVAGETVRKIKDKAPKSSAKGKHYRAGWKKRRDRNKDGKRVYTVYNATKPTLTHLLERGHAKTNGGRVAGIKHIEPAAEWAAEEVVERIKDKL